MAVYRIGRCHQLLNHEEEARKHYGKLPFLVPPEAVSEHPMEVIWIVRGINRMEEIALSDNHETVIHEALMMLEWIQKSGIQSISEIKNRRNALSKRGIFSLEQRLET